MSDLFRKFFTGLFHDFKPHQEDMLWYTVVKEFLSPRDLLDGKFSEYLPKIQTGRLRYIIELYEEAIINQRYFHHFSKSTSIPTTKCPFTNWDVVELEVSQSTIDALDQVWDSTINFDKSKPFAGDLDAYLINHHILIAKLLSISLHLGWALYGGNAKFPRQVLQLKSCEHRGITGVKALDHFICGNPSGQGDGLSEIALYLPKYEKKFFYKPLLEFYERHMDRGDFDRKSVHHHKRDPIFRLTSQAYREYDGTDPEWIAPFAEYYGGEEQEKKR